LNASNTSGVYIKLETVPGAYVAPVLGDFVPVVGTPKFTPRGPGIIRRADVMTPYGGELAAKTGGIGWDISFTTELYWNFLSGAPGVFTANPTGANSVLYALFRSCPFTIAPASGALDNDFKFVSQAIYDVAATRTSANNQCATFSIAYEEIGAKRYEASGCVCTPKFSFEAGGKITVEWSIKGQWRPVTNSTPLVPTYAYPAPLIGINASLTATLQLGASTSALAKVSYDPGFALSDVLDAQQLYGMGIAMISLTSSPSIELEVADLSETLQPDWTEAEDNTLGVSVFQVALTIGANTEVTFTLDQPQLVQWPTPGESNGYRNIGLKFAGIVNANSVGDIGSIGFYSPE
jgi:hypothetical protein